MRACVCLRRRRRRGRRAYGIAILPPLAVTPVTGGDFSPASSILLDSRFGVRVSATEVATHVGALDGRSMVRFSSTDGAVTTGTVAAYGASGIARAHRQDIITMARPQGGGDAMAGMFPNAKPLRNGISDNGGAATKPVPTFAMRSAQLGRPDTGAGIPSTCCTLKTV